MKKFQQLGMVGVFTLVLTTAAFAGEIATGGAPQPPPPNQSLATTPGDIQTSGKQNLQAISDSVADFALNLLQTMLSVF